MTMGSILSNLFKNRSSGSENAGGQFHFWTAILIFNAAMIAAMLLFLSLKEDLSSDLNASQKLYGATFPNMNIAWYRELELEVESNIHARGDMLLVRDCSGSVSLQCEQIIDFVHRGVEAIFVCPVSSDGLEEALIECQNVGIKVVTIGNKLTDDSYVNFCVSSDNREAGGQMARYVAGHLYRADILVLGEQNSVTSLERISGFKEALGSQRRFNIVNTVLVEGISYGSSSQVMECVLDRIESGGGFDVIFASNDSLGLGAYAALKTAGCESVRIVSVDGSPDGKKMVRDGKFIADSGQYPSTLALRATDFVYGRSISAIKEAIVPVRLITKNTITSYGTDRWE